MKFILKHYNWYDIRLGSTLNMQEKDMTRWRRAWSSYRFLPKRDVQDNLILKYEDACHNKITVRFLDYKSNVLFKAHAKGDTYNKKGLCQRTYKTITYANSLMSSATCFSREKEHVGIFFITSIHLVMQLQKHLQSGIISEGCVVQQTMVLALTLVLSSISFSFELSC